MHCHLERLVSWGMGMVFIVRNGKHTNARVLICHHCPICPHARNLYPVERVARSIVSFVVCNSFRVFIYFYFGEDKCVL